MSGANSDAGTNAGAAGGVGQPGGDAGGGGSSGGSAFGAAAGASAPASGAAGGTPAAPAPAPAPAAPAAAPAPPAPLHARIPEKYLVKNADGSVDIEASTAKLLDGHAALEQRLGSGGGLPPKNPEEYAPDVKRWDFAELKKDEEFQSWLKGAHARGMTNEQVAYNLDYFAERLQTMGAGMSVEEAQQALAGVQGWETPDQFNANVALGLKAIQAAVPGITRDELNSIPNHPVIFRVLAKFGAEVGEARQPSDTAAISDADFDTQLAAIQRDPAFMNASHPDHNNVMKKYNALFAARFPANAA